MKKRLLIIVFVFTLIFSPILSTPQAYGTSVHTMSEEEFDNAVEFMGRVAKFVQENYLYPLSYEEILLSLYQGMFNHLDPYSVYYTPEEYAQFTTEMSGEFSGVGIQIVRENNQIMVVTPLPHSPAEKAGILPRDIIRYVDQVDITGYTTEEAANLIRGPVGSRVTLGIERSGQLIYFNVTRDNIVVSSVYSEVLNEDIGYLRITQFNENTAQLLAREMYPLMDEEIQKLIIDLRNNPGGSLSEVIQILNIFVPEGPLAYVIRNDGSETVYTSSLSVQNYEIVVLVNEGSASASEIFAGAIQDRKAGTVVGTQTYGKGVVQTLYPLIDGSAIKLTTAEYITANRNSVQGIGITPDIIVENNRSRGRDVDTSLIPTFAKNRKPDIGYVGLDVLAAEMILEILGYPVEEPDGVFDQTLKDQITQFQRDQGTYPYGVLDFTTQDALSRALDNYLVDTETDFQLEKALELLN